MQFSHYRQRNYLFLIFGLFFFIVSVGLIIFTSPESKMGQIGFFSSVFLSVICLGAFIGHKMLRGFLLASIFSAFLLLRFFGFRHWLITIALFSLAVSLEIFLRRRKVL